MSECRDKKDDAVFRARRILVVEDEALIAIDLKARLEDLGYDVPAIGASADMALDLACCHNPDLILMDIRLRDGSDGIEAASEVRQRLNIPIIFLTSYFDAETLERARLTQPFGYIVKPFASVNLRAALEIAFQKHESELSLRESLSWYFTLERRRLTRLFDGQAFTADEYSDGNRPAGTRSL
jgi:CheY-like chemotaxis protein